MKDDDAKLEQLVTRALVERGELLPTTTEQVLETEGEYRGELPPSLAGLYDKGNVVPLPRRSHGWRALSYVVAFAAGAAAVGLWLYADREPSAVHVAPEQGARSLPAATPPPAPPLSSAPVIAVPPPRCEATCCAGADCALAKMELASCPTERTCVPCQGLDDKETRYRVRLGNVESRRGLPLEAMGEFDLCVSAGSAQATWSCEPAYLPASARPYGRFLRRAMRAEDLMAGLSLELRTKGTTEVVAGWRSGIRIGAASLCKGVSITLHDSANTETGVLSMFLEPTYYVELGRGRQRAEVERAALGFSFQGRDARFVTAARGADHVLALGPFDRPEAEQLLEQLRNEAGASIPGLRLELGDDYDDDSFGAPASPPARD